MARLGITTSELELPSMLHLPFNHTVTLILITCIISFIAFSKEQVMNRLIFWPPAIQRGQYDRFISHGFIHADGTHLLFNMITLFFFGSIIESFYRQYLYDLGFVLFYLGGLIAAIGGRIFFSKPPSSPFGFTSLPY